MQSFREREGVEREREGGLASSGRSAPFRLAPAPSKAEEARGRADQTSPAKKLKKKTPTRGSVIEEREREEEEEKPS